MLILFSNFLNWTVYLFLFLFLFSLINKKFKVKEYSFAYVLGSKYSHFHYFKDNM